MSTAIKVQKEKDSETEPEEMDQSFQCLSVVRDCVFVPY